MKSRGHEREESQLEIFKVELTRIIDPGHEMIRLADAIDWENFEHLFTDQGYRGHKHESRQGDPEIHVDKKRRGRTPRCLWKWMKCRAAVESGIGHLKNEHRLNRNQLWGKEGDMHNVILSAAGMNFHKLLDHLGQLWLWLTSGSVSHPFQQTSSPNPMSLIVSLPRAT